MRWKWAGGAFVLLIAAVIVSVYVILSGYDVNRLKPQIARAALENTGRKLTIGGNIGIGFGFAPLLLVENVGLQNAPWGSRPEMVRIRRVEVQLALFPLIFGEIEIRRLVLVEPDILIETDRSGGTNFEFKAVRKEIIPESGREKTPSVEATLPAFFFKDLRIKEGTLTYKGNAGNRPFTALINTFQAKSKSTRSPITFTMKGACNGGDVDVSGTLGALTDLTDPHKNWSVNLTANAGDSVFTLDGTVDDPLHRRGLQLNFELQGKDVASLKQFFGKPLPLKGPFEIRGRLSDPAPDIYKISDFKAASGDNAIDGSLEISLSGRPPKLSAALSSKKLDLRPFLKGNPGVNSAGAPEPASARDRVFSDTPLPVQVLAAVDADAEISVARLIMPRLALRDLAVNVHLKNGRLEVAPFKAVIGGGMLDGRVNLESTLKPMALAAKLTVDQLDLARMLKELGITDSLEGKLDADFDLTSRGESVAALMAGLNGHTRMEMNNGRINSSYVDLLGGDLSSGILYLINPLKEKAEYTQIRCFVSLFDVKNGLAESTAFVLSTDRMNVVGEGTIDLKTEKLDISFIPVAREGIGGISASLGELTNPFKLGGTLASPSIAVDSMRSAITFGKAAGGFLLFGPFGVAAALLDTKSGDKNPCLTAIEAAKKGVKAPEEKKGTVTKAVDDAKEGIRGFGKKLKGLFGK